MGRHVGLRLFVFFGSFIVVFHVFSLPIVAFERLLRLQHSPLCRQSMIFSFVVMVDQFVKRTHSQGRIAYPRT